MLFGSVNRKKAESKCPSLNFQGGPYVLCFLFCLDTLNWARYGSLSRGVTYRHIFIFLLKWGDSDGGERACDLWRCELWLWVERPHSPPKHSLQWSRRKEEPENPESSKSKSAPIFQEQTPFHSWIFMERKREWRIVETYIILWVPSTFTKFLIAEASQIRIECVYISNIS
jgi:hypothetical protein